MYTTKDIRRVSDKMLADTEDAMFTHTKAVIEAQQEWQAAAPARIREYNRPINRLRRSVTEYRRRIALAVDVLRDRHDCGDDY